MFRPNVNRRYLFLVLFILLGACTHTATAQSTSFTYQGRLNDNNQPASGNYDFEFKLFTALTGGTQEGVTQQKLNVAVSNGGFTVLLDFGAGAFPGADRFLEIGVRPAGGTSFTPLSPLQQITLTPYAIHSASAEFADHATNANDATNAANATNATTANNALQLGGVGASQFVQTNDSRLSDARNPLPNSVNYIRNNSALQPLSQFNISGNGTVGSTLTARVVSAETTFNIGSSAVLRSPGTSNIFVGQGAGYPLFTSGDGNSFFGVGAGSLSLEGDNNAFFGFEAGHRNDEGNNNSYFGKEAGHLNTTGSANSFFGVEAGETNTTGSSNTIIGSRADVGANNLTNSTAIGNRALVNSSNALVLGSVNGKNGATEDTNVGIGTTAPGTPLDIESQLDRPGGSDIPNLRITNYGEEAVIGGRSTSGTRSAPTAIRANDKLLVIEANGYTGSGFPYDSQAKIEFIASEDWTTTANGTSIRFYASPGGATGGEVTFNGRVGIGLFSQSPAQQLDVGGDIRTGSITGTTGCVQDRDGTVIAGNCVSDLRFKRNITSFDNVLNSFSKLRPVNFFWRADEFADKHFGTKQSFGLIAQEAEQAFPDLVATDEQGFKSVNYSKLPLLTIQAVKELKAESDTLKQQVDEHKKQAALQQQQLQQQKTRIDELMKTLSSIQTNKATDKRFRRATRVSNSRAHKR